MGKTVVPVDTDSDLPLSPAVRAGQYIFVSGQAETTDQSGNDVVSVEEQTRLCLEKIKTILAAAGATLDDIVRVSVFLARGEDFAAMNGVYSGYFPASPPARTTTVASFVHDEILVEMDCIAHRSD